ncbi:hypothetical protein BC828DRAFT_385311 [Blastocladiella britannica]|nr:hypothetical protein BC828DRAFT_385311 [Blastocladiella britannica]
MVYIDLSGRLRPTRSLCHASENTHDWFIDNFQSETSRPGPSKTRIESTAVTLYASRKRTARDARIASLFAAQCCANGGSIHPLKVEASTIGVLARANPRSMARTVAANLVQAAGSSVAANGLC